jgi:AcrR family transcriptional regulator
MNVVQSHRKARNHGREERRAVRDRARGDRRRARTDRRESPRSRREVKPAEERRKDILDAALRLFADRGFNDTTVGDIAAEAHMGTGTVYLYFPSKEDVLQGLHDRFREQNLAAITAVAVDAMERAGAGEAVDYRETVDAILDAIAALFVANRDLVVVCTKFRPEDMYEHPRAGGHGGNMNPAGWALQEGVRLGLIHTSDPEMTGYLFDAALAFNLHTHITFGDPPDLDRLMTAAKEMIHKTLALPPEPQPAAQRPAKPRKRKAR